MKLKTTFLSTIICLLLFSFSASAQWCGTVASGKYQWRVETNPTNAVITVHPIATTTGILVFPSSVFPNGGYILTKNGAGDYVYTFNGTYTDGAQAKFYFLHQNGGVQDQSETLTYTIGQDCLGSATNTKPVVEITGFESSNGLVAPETILLTATATDEDGTITKVEFFNGATSIGLGTVGTDNQYNLQWTNVNPGTYNNITAKATDDKSGTTTSDPFPSFTVGGEFTNEWCGQSAGAAVPSTGDEFQWRAETADNGDVIVTFHGIGAAAGCDFAIVSGVLMAADGSGNLTALITGKTPGSSLSLSFTYRRGTATSNTGENNSNGNPVNYTVGTLCAMSTLPVSLTDFRSKVQADGTVALTWATTSENNNNHFVIEKSADNSSFVTLDNVASKGINSQNRLNYSFTDKNPTNGTNYYRLSQVDNNGTVTVLGIVAETVSLNSLSTVYPNPLHGTTLNLSLAGQADGQVAVDISTLAGKIIYSGTTQIVAGQGSVSLVSKPAPGLYLVKTGDKSFKLIVE